MKRGEKKRKKEYRRARPRHEVINRTTAKPPFVVIHDSIKSLIAIPCHANHPDSLNNANPDNDNYPVPELHLKRGHLIRNAHSILSKSKKFINVSHNQRLPPLWRRPWVIRTRTSSKRTRWGVHRAIEDQITSHVTGKWHCTKFSGSGRQ